MLCMGQRDAYKLQCCKTVTMPVQSVPRDLAVHCLHVETVSTGCQVALLTVCTLHLKYWYTLNTSSFFCSWRNTGLFISPSGISELDSATTKTDTAERSISIGRESLQVFFVLGALAYFQVPPLGGSHEEKWRSQ